MSELRIDIRKRVFLKGRIVFNGGSSTMDCLVRDMSDTGARMALSETTTLPEIFDLFIPQKDKTYRCKLAWRREDGVGVTFVEDQARSPAAGAVVVPTAEPISLEASMSALLRRVSELETENAALRRLLSTLAAPATAA